MDSSCSGFLAILLVGAFAASCSAEAVNLYVARDGGDAWSGRLEAPNAADDDGPFATLERARDEIRALKAASQCAHLGRWGFCAHLTGCGTHRGPWRCPRHPSGQSARRQRGGPIWTPMC